MAVTLNPRHHSAHEHLGEAIHGLYPRRSIFWTAVAGLGLASAREVTLRSERLRYLPQQLALPVQFARRRDHLRHLLSIGEAPTASATGRDLALARGPKFRD